jgi:ComF family protein
MGKDVKRLDWVTGIGLGCHIMALPEPAQPISPGRLRQFLGRTLDLVLPPQCLLCAAPVLQQGGLCPACFARMPFIEQPCCDRYGTPFATDWGGAGLLSPRAISDPPVFGRARAVARFDGPARELVHRLKYGDRLYLACAMGGWMARAGADLFAGADALVPVPLHRSRLWRRRFNQAALLAGAVAAPSGLPVMPDLVQRVRPTRSQVGLSASERARNLQGALRVAEGSRPKVRDRRFVLIDDVMTTASTANAAARALLRAGAANVDVLVFALVAGDDRS